jgi:AAA domain-containing protein
MTSDSINQDLNALNKTFDGLSKTLQEKKRQEIISILGHMAEVMRKKGSSKQSIQLALKGTYEYWKLVNGIKVPLGKSELNQLAYPESTASLNLELSGIKLSEVETQQVDWLWEKRIPLGNITVLDGDPGMGKSLLATNLAARVSIGSPMPDGTPGKQGSVILIAPEDGAGDTIRPRIEAAGGEPSKVLLLNFVNSLDVKNIKKLNMSETPFSLSRDLYLLEEAIEQTRAILVVLDPLTAVLGHNVASSRGQGVREVLTPLKHLAERTGCAILIIRHLNKSSSDNLLYRGAGSIDIIAAARCGLIVAYDPVDEQKRVLATTKNNLSKFASNLTYQVVENERGTPYIQWSGENHHDISSLLAPGINLSFARQDIIKVLKESKYELDAKQIAELTGQNYKSIRMALSRMHEAGIIARPYRGKYTTLDNPSMAERNALVSRLESRLNSLRRPTSVTNVTSDASVTSATKPFLDSSSD